MLFAPDNIKISLKTMPTFIVKCLFFYSLGFTIGTFLEQWETNKVFKILANIFVFMILIITVPGFLSELQQTIPGLFFASIFNTQPSLYSPKFQ